MVPWDPAEGTQTAPWAPTERPERRSELPRKGDPEGALGSHGGTRTAPRAPTAVTRWRPGLPRGDPDGAPDSHGGDPDGALDSHGTPGPRAKRRDFKQQPTAVPPAHLASGTRPVLPARHSSPASRSPMPFSDWCRRAPCVMTSRPGGVAIRAWPEHARSSFGRTGSFREVSWGCMCGRPGLVAVVLLALRAAAGAPGGDGRRECAGGTFARGVRSCEAEVRFSRDLPRAPRGYSEIV